MIGAGGAAVLGAASCVSCQRIIHRLETEIQNKMFGQLRIRLGMKQSAVPESAPGILFDSFGETTEFRAHPRDLPSGILVPVYANRPGLWVEPGEPHKPLYTWQISPIHGLVHCEKIEGHREVGLELWSNPV